MDRLLVKWETARSLVPQAEIEYSKFRHSAILSVGSSDGAVREALIELAAKNIGMNYCRLKAFPFGDDVKEFIYEHERIYVVEQNRDAQLRSLLIMDLEIDPARLTSVLHYDGMPLNASFVVDRVVEDIARGRAA